MCLTQKILGEHRVKLITSLQNVQAGNLRAPALTLKRGPGFVVRNSGL